MNSNEGCPIQHDNANNRPVETSSVPQQSFLESLWWPTQPQQPTPATKSDGCPVAKERVASVEKAAKYAQTPQPNQKVPMTTHRQVSSIPRDATDGPHHQSGTDSESKWVYPSEQQLYNAMRRKGWSNIPEESIKFVLQIHNTTNERTWRQIEDWEDTDKLKLVRFQGRPRDLTPLAWFYSTFTGVAPFDRHDWYVERKDSGGQLQRYVIDYYDLPTSSQQNENQPPQTYVDVRPALDHPRGFALRATRFLADAFPGISGLLRRQLQSSNDRPMQK